MSGRETVVFLALAAACSGQTEIEADATVTHEPPRAPVTLEGLPPMPDYPGPHKGRLVVVSDGDFSINKVWKAEAGACSTAYNIELYAEDDSSGTLIVFYYPEGNPEGSYEIMSVDSVDVGECAAIVGVQIFRQQEAFGFQAIEGSVELRREGEVLTGRFASTVREVQSEALTRYVGVFQEIRLVALSPEYCSALEQEPLQLDEISPIRRY